MIVLYLFARIFLALAHALVRFRVSRLEKRYVRTAAAADALLKTSATKSGNNRPDPYVTAKQQYELARLALKRDQVEARYTGWQSFSERFGKMRAGLAGYRGVVVPYLFGLVDVGVVVGLMNHYALRVNEVRAMLGL